jgi:hypothetical protein
VFQDFVRPKIGASVANWDNMSADKEYNAHDHLTNSNLLESSAWKSFKHCHDLCDSQKECVQFSYEPGSCSIAHSFRLGHAKPGERKQSGWMMDRVDDLFLKLEGRCGVRDWFAPAVEGGSLSQRRRR